MGTTVRWPRLKVCISSATKRVRYGEVGDFRKLAVSISLIGRIFKTSRTVHQYKEVSVQFIGVLFREYHNTGGVPA